MLDFITTKAWVLFGFILLCSGVTGYIVLAMAVGKYGSDQKQWQSNFNAFLLGMGVFFGVGLIAIEIIL